LIIFFFLSIISCLGVLFIERIFEIGIYYHPDAEYYLTYRENVNLTELFQNPKKFIGQFYIIITSLYKYNTNYLIGFNILIYSITNAYLFQFVKNTYKKMGLAFYFAVFIVLLDPYRIHLAVHVLKDTLIIFSLTILFFSRSYIIKIIYLIFGVFLRFSFFVYLPILISDIKISKRSIFFIIITFYIAVYPFYDLIINTLTIQGQKADMSFRQFDTIPNFLEYELFGGLFRSITWPIFRLTGTAYFFSSFYILFLLHSLALMYIILVNIKIVKTFLFKFLLFIFPLIALAYSVTGYNSYLRYTQPIITLLPIFIIYYSYKIRLK